MFDSECLTRGYLVWFVIVSFTFAKVALVEAQGQLGVSVLIGIYQHLQYGFDFCNYARDDGSFNMVFGHFYGSMII